MNTAANPAFRPSAHDLRSMNHAVTWSIALHVVVVVGLLVVPRDWLSERPVPMMTISLGGAPGTQTTGTSSIGGRTVEQVAPPPRRPDPIRPAPKSEPAPAAPPASRTPPAAPRPSDVPRPEPQVTRPPTTGQQITPGSTPVDTGARGQTMGLTQTSGGTGGETDLSTFCCPEYLRLLTQRIDTNWEKNQPEKGVTEIRFTILRDGTVTNIEYAVRSGSSVLDRVSRNAITDLRPLPLPSAYPGEKLTIRITFPYQGN